MGRYSYLGIDPVFVFRNNGQDPLKKIGKILEKYPMAAPKNGMRFLGGAVGYLTYDLGIQLEKKLKFSPKPGLGVPDCAFGFYNTVVIIDHFKRSLNICASGFPEKNYLTAKLLARENLKKMERIISQSTDEKDGSLKNQQMVNPAVDLKSNFSKAEYLRAVKRAKAYIRAGDIYQVNLSQRFQAKTNLSACQIYQRLRQINPACFCAYFDAGDFQILSSSPERFLSLEKGKVTTRPMKGTRARSANRKKDLLLKADLLKSAKDKAELVMIVDLERNDLGKVCSYDSIAVTNLRKLEKYNTVYQTTATIEGKLFPAKTAIDLVRACFPGGSITGCPKMRAMEIINELEPDRRSIYTGALGYLSFSGEMDFNILIRTILKKDKRIYFGVGGGIVADSSCEEEYEETLVKAKAMFEAIHAH